MCNYSINHVIFDEYMKMYDFKMTSIEFR